MSAGFPEVTVAGDVLLSSGSDLRAVAEELRLRLDRLTASAQSLTGVGGDDDISALIGEGYRSVHAMAVESIGSAVDGLSRHGDGVLRMRTTYAAAEQAVEQAVAKAV
ncbi:hypothetical protein AB0395_01500 [Streptosporangium sp. NPDC051023]|uniref:hypothetical protein n=1 Tax=Streptosporangium sp. NPDC051023 TaxID=3155410 RepID=UPI00344EB106